MLYVLYTIGLMLTLAVLFGEYFRKQEEEYLRYMRSIAPTLDKADIDISDIPEGQKKNKS